ncbi:hypothetical protein HPP92_013053 [Vanilla planifolia]|uniref:RNA-polymerase II-associated protein 3-like C-terminal domain-containing protein n=1 Tax=Vanilla planifolia TaxID=51239 RepID=A0A835QXZ2_VANPL|nr:hypothetical protein HPP92_013053 [Vanilla planifolia]
MEFRGFLKDMQAWDSLSKDGGNRSKVGGHTAEKSATGKLGDGKGAEKFHTTNIKKTIPNVADSKVNKDQFGYPRSLKEFDPACNSFLDEKLPDATTEKELGNEYFKKKKFLEAIECYSRSIAFSPTSVAFANRAMAYLKVKKFEEAERDCTEALDLDDRYVKAYSRRVTARKELGKLKEAMEDADFAVRLEPNNAEIRKQYSEIKSLLERKFAQNASSENTSNATLNESRAQGIYSFRNNAQTAEASTAQTKDFDKKVPGKPLIWVADMDKRSASTSTESMDWSNSLDHLGENAESKLNNNVTMEAFVGNIKQEIKSSAQELAFRAASRVMATTTRSYPTPTSAYQFEVSWRSLSDDATKQANLLKSIPPQELPKIFKNALSAPILVDIIRRTATFFRDDTVLAVNVLENLAKVPRFDMMVMCLSAMERAEIRSLWDEVFSSPQVQEDLKETLGRLKPKYCYGDWESHNPISSSF